MPNLSVNRRATAGAPCRRAPAKPARDRTTTCAQDFATSRICWRWSAAQWVRHGSCPDAYRFFRWAGWALPSSWRQRHWSAQACPRSRASCSGKTGFNHERRRMVLTAHEAHACRVLPRCLSLSGSPWVHVSRSSSGSHRHASHSPSAQSHGYAGGAASQSLQAHAPWQGTPAARLPLSILGRTAGVSCRCAAFDSAVSIKRQPRLRSLTSSI